MTLTPGMRAGRGGFQVDGASGSENSFVIDGTEVSNFRTQKSTDGETEEFSGRLLFIAKPVYPLAARQAKATGEVAVEIEVDAKGTVTSSKAVSGYPMLAKSSEHAATDRNLLRLLSAAYRSV